MKNHIYIFFIFIICVLCFSNLVAKNLEHIDKAPDNTPSSSIAFIENKGQWNSNIKYMLKSKNFHAWITDSGELVYDYYNIYTNSSGERHVRGDILKIKFNNLDNNRIPNNNIISNNNIIFSNNNTKNRKLNFIPIKKIQQAHNYFSATSAATNVCLYEEILIENIYDGINIRYYLDSTCSHQIRYDFEISPNANPEQIQFNIEGASSTTINKKNELIIQTENSTYCHKNIFAYQTHDNIKHQINCSFEENNGIISFKLDKYDSSKKLVIDPLIYSILIGSTEADYAYSVIVDSSGAAYITGETYSPHFPTTAGSYNRIFNQDYDQTGNIDAFVSKISPDGSQIIFSTFIGGTKRDKSKYIALDKSNNIIISGETESANTVSPHVGFPLKSTNPNLARYNGGWDIFVTKLSNTGDSLIFSILLGGNTYDISGGLFVDSQNKIYVSGEVSNSSVSFLTTTGAYSSTFRGGTSDVLVSIIDSSGTNILYSTLFGGESADSPVSVTVDRNRNVYIIGNTASDSLPVTPLAYQQLRRGQSNIFIAKFDSTLSYLLSSTYIGGSGEDFVKSATISQNINSNNSIYACGYTYSKNFPTTSGAYSNSLTDSADVIVFKINSSLSDLLFSTTISSNSHNYATGIKLDKDKNIHISGYTKSTNFPTTYDAFFDTYSDYGDAFYSVLDSSASNLLYSSYIGGHDYDYAYDIALDTAGSAYISGATTSGYNFPYSKVFSDTINLNQTLGRYDALIFKATSKAYPGELETNINTFGNEFCLGASQLVNIYTPYAFYFSDNIFTVQLSDTNGNFSNPVAIGALASSTGGSTVITFPENLPVSSKYRVRVVSSRPRSIGQDNGIDLILSKEYLELADIDTMNYYCAGEEINILFRANKCFNPNNKFNLELSDTNGNFTSSKIIGVGEKTSGSISQYDTISAVIPENIITSGKYKIRLVSTSPQSISEPKKINLIFPKINMLLNNELALCAGEKFKLSFTTNQCFTNNDTNIYFVVLSLPNSEFDNSCDTIFNGLLQNSLDYIYKSFDTTNLICTIPENITEGSRYKLRIYSSNPNIYTDSDDSISIIIGPPHIFTNNFENKEFCKSYSFTVPVVANTCFNPDNIFEIYLKIAGEFIKIGNTTSGDTLAHFTIPDSIGLSGNRATMKIKSTSPEVSTPEFNIIISDPHIKITSVSPEEICVGRVIQVAYSSNNCFNSSSNIFVKLSDSTGDFNNSVIIGSADFFDDSSTISATIPENTTSGIYKIKLLVDSVYSEEFELKVNRAEVAIDTNLYNNSFCAGSSFQLDYLANNCFNFNNIFRVILSDEFGNFDNSSAQIIGETNSATTGKILVTLPVNILESNNYKLKIISTSPATSKVFNKNITIQKPEIIIDSLKNIYICIDENTNNSFTVNTLNSKEVTVPFTASDCFDESNKFILQLAPNGNFSQCINLDTCNWNERNFKVTFPKNLPDAFYRMRVISTSPEVISKDNGVDIKFAKPSISFWGSIPTVICKNSTTRFEYFATNCFEDDNIFYLEISDNTGNFEFARIISYSLNNSHGVFNSVLPGDIQPGAGYQLRIRSTSPAKIFQEKIKFFVAEPEILTGNLNRTILARNDSISVPFNTNCIDDSIKNTANFVVQLSDPRGNFNNPLEIGGKIGWAPDGLIFSRIPYKASDGTKYRIRVVSKEPLVLIGNNNEKNITIRGNVSVSEKEENTTSENYSVYIYPSPFNDFITIETNNTNILNIEISDIIGNIILSKNNIYDNFSSNFSFVSDKITFDTNKLPDGIYFISIYTNSTIKKAKIIKLSNFK